jgi:hypothetical protein
MAMTLRQRVKYQATPESEARILLLIDGFSRTGRKGTPRHLEGRTKMAKLDFLLRYPRYLRRALDNVGALADEPEIEASEESPIENRMIRYRYGPWDPSYFAVLGSLIGRGLIEANPLSRGFGYRTTPFGASTAQLIADDESYYDLVSRVRSVREHFDWSGSRLKDFIYQNFPEVTDAEWAEDL